jgi:hypothetical protein
VSFVVLEAVEVEQRQHHGAVGLRRLDGALEIGQKLSAVAEPGQCVGVRLGLELAASRTERQAREDDDEQRDREHGQRSRAGGDEAGRRLG